MQIFEQREAYEVDFKRFWLLLRPHFHFPQLSCNVSFGAQALILGGRIQYNLEFEKKEQWLLKT